MIDLFSVRNRNSEVTDLSGNHSLTLKSVLHEMSMPKINILVSSFEPKLENLIKAEGDCIEINPETERAMKKTHQRRDMFQNEILKGKKQHKVTFRDQIPGQSLRQIKYSQICSLYNTILKNLNKILMNAVLAKSFDNSHLFLSQQILDIFIYFSQILYQ